MRVGRGKAAEMLRRPPVRKLGGAERVWKRERWFRGKRGRGRLAPQATEGSRDTSVDMCDSVKRRHGRAADSHARLPTVLAAASPSLAAKPHTNLL